MHTAANLHPIHNTTPRVYFTLNCIGGVVVTTQQHPIHLSRDARSQSRQLGDLRNRWCVISLGVGSVPLSGVLCAMVCKVRAAVRSTEVTQQM